MARGRRGIAAPKVSINEDQGNFCCQMWCKERVDNGIYIYFFSIMVDTVCFIQNSEFDIKSTRDGF